ncbi:hypothetical protein [Paraflavitalea soli]|nr:hypothetical protein [Paraflavitalea soli]
MPVSEQYKAPFYPGNSYHITFRSIDGLILFHDLENHDFFLQRFTYFLQPVLSCLAYCLLKNHAHFIVHINDRKNILDSLGFIVEEKKTMAMKKFINDPENEGLIDELVERQINNFMISYVNALNKALSRKGSLFQSPFRRVQIEGDAHLQQAIIYTNANAQKHGIVRDFKEHRYTSYHDVVADVSSVVDIAAIGRFFRGKEHFIKEHEIHVQRYYKGED